jgi:UDP-N-acetylmuramoyl-L-alanyl-D-glutamate--2,6-diaminopimelate ligase
MTAHLPRAGLALSSLARELNRVGATLRGDGAVVVRDVRQDSRRVVSGDLFVARDGARSRGTDYVSEAVARGATAVLLQRGSAPVDECVPVIEVGDVRLAIALAAEAVHDHPSRSLRTIGITGTNGKTTTTWLVQQAIDAAGGRAARLGTLGYGFASDAVDSPLTTPEADEVSRHAARCRDAGGTHLVMEVSSHALAQARADALHFAVAAFTNLTQDHLDYHGTMEAYGLEKARLFWELGPEVSVINVDDPFGARLAARTPGRVLRVSRSDAGEVRTISAELDAGGIRARVALPSGVLTIHSRLVGEHNLDNLLTTLAIVDALGLDPERAALALELAPPIPGRLERCDEPGDDILVLVDYAHTPDALRRVLEAVRRLTTGQVRCVFGCGGDRDPDKRPKMGRAVGELADQAILSNDNPRTESPEAIAAQIEVGLREASADYVVDLDRAHAIEASVLGARAGDVVLIAGKGHEPYQIFGSERRPFDDRVEARRALALRRAKGSG